MKKLDNLRGDFLLTHTVCSMCLPQHEAVLFQMPNARCYLPWKFTES